MEPLGKEVGVVGEPVNRRPLAVSGGRVGVELGGGKSSIN